MSSNYFTQSSQIPPISEILASSMLGNLIPSSSLNFQSQVSMPQSLAHI